MVVPHSVPVEFLHGLGQHPEAWDAVIAAMPEWADSAAPTIPSVSAPAHEPFSLDVAARWVISDLIDRSEEPAVLVGLSLGSLIAIRVAELEPGLVSGLVLSSPLARAPKLLIRMQRTLFGVLPERTITGPKIVDGGTGLTKANLLEVLDVLGDLDLRAELTRIQVPTLVLVGGDDRANRRSSGDVTELMPDATMQVVPGVGHEWNTTHPERFAAAIAGWMEQQGLVGA